MSKSGCINFQGVVPYVNSNDCFMLDGEGVIGGWFWVGALTMQNMLSLKAVH